MQSQLGQAVLGSSGTYMNACLIASNIFTGNLLVAFFLKGYGLTPIVCTVSERPSSDQFVTYFKKPAIIVYD